MAFEIPHFCHSQSTFRFKCPLLDSILTVGWKRSTFNGTVFSHSSFRSETACHSQADSTPTLCLVGHELEPSTMDSILHQILHGFPQYLV